MLHLISRLRRSSLVRGIVIVGALTALARGIAVVRELVVAGTFGVGEELDAVFAALVIPVFLVGILTSTVQAALIPELVAAQSSDSSPGFEQIMASAVSWVGMFTGSLAVVMVTLSGPIMAVMTTGLGPEATALAVDGFRLAVPILVAGGVLAVWTSALQSLEAFAASSLALVLIPATPALIVATIGFEVGALALVWGVTLGHVLALGPLAWGLVRRGISLRVGRPVLAGPLRSAIRQSAPVAAGSVVHAGAPVVDIGMAGALGGGSIAALQFGVRVVDGAVGVMASAIGVTIFPRLARLAGEGDDRAIMRTARRWITLAVLLGIVVSATIVLLSESIVRILFLRGAFPEASVGVVASVQLLYALQIPFYLAGIVLARIVNVIRRNGILLIAAATNLSLNVILNLILMRWMGVPGIALATSAVYFVSAVVVTAGLSRAISRPRR